MSNTTSHSSGRFIWHELLTTDVEAAKGFYGELFGWKSRAMEMGPMGTYTVLSVGDKDIAGMMKPQKGGTRWLAYCTVPDVDAAMKTATDGGASVAFPAMTVPGIGRFAALQHGLVGEIAPMTAEKESPDTDDKPALGTFCWNELVTQEPAKAAAFLGSVFGWQAEDKPMGPMGTYTILKRGEKQAAGIMKAMDAKMPAAWLGYVAVDDVVRAHDRAKRLGASELVPETAIPGLGRFTVIADKQGAMIALFQGA